MPLFDLPLEQLRNYTSSAVPPADFDAFWDRTIAEARALPLNAVFEPVDNYLSVINTYDVTYSGFGGDRIKGWLHIPSHLEPGQQLPVVVEYIGYSGGRGLVNQKTRWAQAGYGPFIMETPGQGARADTPASSWTPAARATGAYPVIPRIRTHQPAASTMQA